MKWDNRDRKQNRKNGKKITAFKYHRVKARGSVLNDFLTKQYNENLTIRYMK